MGESVVAYVAKNPGQSVEQIGKALGAKTKELALPIIRMIEAKEAAHDRRATGDAVLREVGEMRGWSARVPRVNHR